MNKTYPNEKYAEEESSCGVEFQFFDTDGETPVTPASLSYSFVNEAGEVINSKEDIEITPANKILITLSGDDLAIPENGQVSRFVVIKGVYYSNTLGTVSLKTQHEFTLKPLKR
jgi:hypothetical protein